MLRVARLYTRSAAEAEDVVQETWMAVLLGRSGFQGRSSLRTWIFRILSNIARKRAVRDRRTIPFSQLVRREVASTKALVDHQFVADDDLEWAGHWDTTVSDWGQRGDLVLMSAEVLACIAGAMRTMPPAQSEVLRLRDRAGDRARSAPHCGSAATTSESCLIAPAAGHGLPSTGTSMSDQTPIVEVVCRTIVELVTERLEGTLDTDRKEAFDAHLVECEDCVRFVDQIQAVIRVLHGLRFRLAALSPGPIDLPTSGRESLA